MIELAVARPIAGIPEYLPSSKQAYRGGSAAAPAWTPADLYSGDGDWWLATDLTTLFQDSAKTTGAASDGDVIGAWVGQMGVGPDLANGGGSNKPLLFVSGGETAVQLPLNTDVWLIGTLPSAIAYTDDLTLWAVTRSVVESGNDDHFIPALRDSNNPAASTRQRLAPQAWVSVSRRGAGYVRTAASPVTQSATNSTATTYKSMALVRSTSGTAGSLYTGTAKVAANIGTATTAQNAITIDSTSAIKGSVNIVALGYIRRAISDAEMALISAWAVSTFGAQF